MFVCDGKLYIGEAKSNNEIDSKQFSFYKDLCKRTTIDGIVFATAEKQWNVATLKRIEQLKSEFDGEVLALTHGDLYSTSEEQRNQKV